MEINGLPLHPLAVHGAVVLAPIAALLAIAYVVPAWRDRLRWPVAAASVLAAGAVALAYYSGTSFREANPFFNDPSLPATEQIDEHEANGERLFYSMLGFSAYALVTVALHDRAGRAGWVLSALLAGGAIGIIVLTVLTGDAGARAVWGEGYEG